MDIGGNNMTEFDPRSVGAVKFDPASIGAVKAVPKEEPVKRSGFEKVTDFFAKTTSDTVSAIKEGIGHRKRVSQANDEITQLQERNKEIIAEAKSTSNPLRKAELLEESRAISTRVGQVADEVEHGEKQFLMSADISEKDIERGNGQFAVRRGVGTALEVGAMLAPGTKEAKSLLKVGQAARGGERLARGAASGAITGTLGSGSRAAVEADTIQDAASQVVKGAAAGASIGALTNFVLGKRPQTAAKAMQEKQKTIYNDLANDTTISSRRSKDLFKSQFNVPDKVARRAQFDKRSEELIKHGVGGNMDDMIATSDYVTGRDGVLSNIHKQAIKSIGKDVDSNVALDAAKKAIEEASEIDSNEANRITKFISSRLKPAGKVGTTSAVDAFDLVRELEATGYQYLNSSTALTPNIGSEQKGKIYIAAANALKDQIDDITFQEGTLSRFKTPENINAMKLVSNRLATQFKNAKSSSDLRRIQAPFVTLRQMANITVDKANTPFSNLGRQSQSLSLTKLPFQLAQKAAESPTGRKVTVGLSAAADRASTGRVAEFLKKLGLAGASQLPRIGSEQ